VPKAPDASVPTYGYGYHWGGPAYFVTFMLRLWPLALIALGVFLLYSRSRRRYNYQ
jgi:hypothetical protein